MASSSSAPLNDELQCSICLDVFTDPVTTPCGHNFCRTCLDKCWTNMKNCFCPLCKEPFREKPDLKINITLREVVQHFKEKLSLEEPEVFCDFCDDRKQKAVKSCLTCESSYCETHLEPHLRVPRLKKHKLINAVDNLEDYICEKHQRPLELFCRDDQTCVCLSCTEGEHRNHNTVPVEQEGQHKKVQTQTDVQQMIQDRIKKIKEIHNSVELRKRNTEKEKSASVDLFTDLNRSFERCQSETLKKMEEEQKAAEKQAEDLIKKLKQEITALKRRNTELEQISSTTDHLHVIQKYSSLYSHLPTKSCTEISIDSDVNVFTLHRALDLLKKSQKAVNRKLCQTGLKCVQKYAVDVTLDPDTANPYLILSDDGKQVNLGEIKQDVPENPKRSEETCVLAKEGFSSGRFYYEVQVKGKTKWSLGVARESIGRKGGISPSPEDGLWSLLSINESEYIACDNPAVAFRLRVQPKSVGVFVAYEEGLVSFYDVDSGSHIYSFTSQTFTDKLYPYFGLGKNDVDNNFLPLIILPISSPLVEAK